MPKPRPSPASPSSAPPDPRRRLPSADRRQQILDGGELLFTTRGFEAVSMGDLASHLGVSRPTIYAYFTSTEAILTALLDARLAEFETRLAPFLDNLRASNSSTRPFGNLFLLLVNERALLTLLQSGGGPVFAARRQAVLTELERRLETHFPPPVGTSRQPFLLACITQLLQGMATNAVNTRLSHAEIGQLAATLDRFANAGLQGVLP
ncbi:TetR/AcrR family transcriptional regulator [Deinococcus sp. Arct2-2]|uniref:TetR/AcrR family transcriptional regulator n=1 Tax=Deinococcus sp. Arct2-2 TaxID=2568653 RepID=UPI0010A551CF|nr:TetR/AcrR family transcriptional regulator [Deinococcus sp. Arct2-2]THF69950.1 TetR/AcrR family transcriptional regulator [Deinococcus sp. Arct2-2]